MQQRLPATPQRALELWWSCRSGLNWDKKPDSITPYQPITGYSLFLRRKCPYLQLRLISRKGLIYEPLADNTWGRCHWLAAGEGVSLEIWVVLNNSHYYCPLTALLRSTCFLQKSAPSGKSISKILVCFTSWGTKKKLLSAIGGHFRIHFKLIFVPILLSLDSLHLQLTSLLVWVDYLIGRLGLLSERLKSVTMSSSGHVWLLSFPLSDQIGQEGKEDAQWITWMSRCFFPSPIVRQLTYLLFMIRVSSFWRGITSSLFVCLLAQGTWSNPVADTA